MKIAIEAVVVFNAIKVLIFSTWPNEHREIKFRLQSLVASLPSLLSPSPLESLWHRPWFLGSDADLTHATSGQTE